MTAAFVLGGRDGVTGEKGVPAPELFGEELTRFSKEGLEKTGPIATPQVVQKVAPGAFG